MITSVVGMPQSGSTWIHNIVLNIFYINKINPYVSLFTTEKILKQYYKKNEQEPKYLSILDRKSINSDFLKLRNMVFSCFSVIDETSSDLSPFFFDKKDKKTKKEKAVDFINSASDSFNLTIPELKSFSYTPYIIKEHHFDEDLFQFSNILFLVKRDIRDSIASRRRRGKKLYSKGLRSVGLHDYDENSFSGFKKYCNYLEEDCIEKWQKKKSNKVHLIKYEESIFKKRETVEYMYSTIQKELESFYGKKEIKNIFEDGYNNKILEILKLTNYKNMKESPCGESRKTFFSNDKITNGGKILDFKAQLSDEEIKFIEENHKKSLYIL